MGSDSGTKLASAVCSGFVACLGTESTVGSGSAEVDCGGSGEAGLMRVGSSISPKVNEDQLNHRA